jgi:hypothetical protein
VTAADIVTKVLPGLDHFFFFLMFIKKTFVSWSINEKGVGARSHSTKQAFT